MSKWENRVVAGALLILVSLAGCSSPKGDSPAATPSAATTTAQSTAAPTTTPAAAPVAFSISETGAVWAPEKGGKHPVTFSVTVKNVGGSDSADVQLVVKGPDGVVLATVAKAYGPIKSGETVKVTAVIEVPSSLRTSKGAFTLTVDASGAVHAQGNNVATHPITQS